MADEDLNVSLTDQPQAPPAEPTDAPEPSGVLAEPPIQLGGLAPDSVEFAMKQDELVKDMDSTFTAWQQWRQPFETMWGEIYGAFLSSLTNGKFFTRARVFVPVAFQIIEAAVPKLVNIIIGQKPFFQVEPQAKTDENWTVAKVLQKILEYQLDAADFFVKFVDFAKQLMLYGTSYFFVFWKVKRGWVWEKVPKREPRSFMGIPMPDKLVWERKKVFKVVERRPDLIVPDIADVYPDPTAQTDQDGTGVIFETRMTLAELEELGQGRFPVYANTEKLKDHAPTSAGKGAATDLGVVREHRRGVRGLGPTQTPKASDARILVRTFWGLRDLDGDGLREEVMIVWTSTGVLLKAQPNPFEHQKRPLLRAVLFPVPLEWFGIGLVEPVLPLISELNTLRNQSLDVNNLIINRMWKVNSMADIDLDTLVSAPNGVVLTDMMDGVEPLAQAPLPSSVYQDSAIIQADIENTTAPRSVQGTPENGALGRTARGAQLIINQALEKFGMAAKLTEENVVVRVLKMFHQLNLQFIDSDEVWSPEGYYGGVYDSKVTPEMLRAEVRFKMLGLSDTVTKEAKINQIISFLTVFKGMPGINFIEAARLMWTLMDAPESAEKIIQPAPFPTQMTTVVGSLGENGAAAQNMAAQAASNGASVPAAVPGARST